MNRFLIRLFTFLMSIILFYSTLTGCGLTNEFFNNSHQGKKLKEVKLKFYFPKCDDNLKKEAVKTLIKKVEAKSRDKLMLRLQFSWSNKGNGSFSEDYGIMDPGGTYEEYSKDILTRIRSGEKIDAFYVRNDHFLKRLVDEGLVKDLSTLLPDYGGKLYRQYTGKDLSLYTYNGTLAMVPNLMPVSRRVYAIVRKDLLKKYKMKRIETLEDLDKYLTAVSDNDKKFTPLKPFWFFHGCFEDLSLVDYFLTNMGFVGQLPYYTRDPKFTGELGIGYRWYDSETRLMPFEQTTEYKNIYNLIRKWYDKKYVYRPLTYAEKPYAASLATMDEMLSYTEKIKGCLTNVGLQEEIEIFPLYPNIPVNKSYYHNAGIAISKNCKNPERVIMFLNWIHESQENYELFMYGEEGVNYKKVGEKMKIFTDNDYEHANDRYFTWVGYSAFMNRNYIRQLQGDSYDLIDLYNRDIKMLVKHPPTAGVNFDIGSLQETILAIQKVRHKYTFEVENSQSYFNDYVSDRVTAGIDNLVEDLQKQLDEWKKERK